MAYPALITLLVISLILCSYCSGEIVDAPPTFNRIGHQSTLDEGLLGVDLTTPIEYIRPVLTAFGQQNIYFCVATNAEMLVWEFAADGQTFTEITAGSGYNGIFSSQPLEINNDATSTIKRVIYDGVNSARSLAMNGYYRCRAGNSFGYSSLSPAIRLIYAEISDSPDSAQPRDLRQNAPGLLQPRTSNGNAVITPTDFSKFFPGRITYVWRRQIDLKDKEIYDVFFQNTVTPKERIHVNKITGGLVFENVDAADTAVFNNSVDTAGTNVYNCVVRLTGRSDKLVTQIYLSVISNTDSPTTITRVIPERTAAVGQPDTASVTISCIKGTTCSIPCSFAGNPIPQQSPTIEREEGYENQVITQPYGVDLVDVTSDASGRWKCSLTNSDDIAIFEVVITDFPNLRVPLKDEYIKSEDKNYVVSCEPTNSGTTEFFVNGLEATSSTPNAPVDTEEDLMIRKSPQFHNQWNIDYRSIGSDLECPEFLGISLHLKNLHRGISLNNSSLNNDTSLRDITAWTEVNGAQLIIKEPRSANILCVLTNGLGSSYHSMNLVVYDEAVVIPSEESIVASTANITKSTEFNFDCTIRLDQKASSIDIYWTSNITTDGSRTWEEFRPGQLADVGSAVKNVVPLTSGEHDDLKEYNTSIILLLDSTSQHTLPNTIWKCVARYRILPNIENFIAQSNDLSFTTTDPPKPQELDVPFDSWWIFGVIGGVIFFVLLILLIFCCVRQNRGEQYYVDEKERKAGHDPESEMKTYGFHDYKRPDQNPVKGSRASMNFSDRPMESDGGSMDEYGDIEPGRFNEDGSFIGQYGSQPPRYQADV